MHDQRRAAGLGAGQGSREMGSLFQIVATAAPDVTLEDLRVAIMDEIARLTNDGPTEAELDRARVQAEASFLFRLQTLGGFGGKADQLNAYATSIPGRPRIRSGPRSIPESHDFGCAACRRAVSEGGAGRAPLQWCRRASANGPWRIRKRRW